MPTIQHLSSYISFFSQFFNYRIIILEIENSLKFAVISQLYHKQVDTWIHGRFNH